MAYHRVLADSDYLAILSITLLLFCTWAATKISRTAGVSSVVLEIGVGIVLGPSIWGHITPAWSECLASRHSKCEAPADLINRVITGGSLGHGLDPILAGPYCDRFNFEPYRSQPNLPFHPYGEAPVRSPAPAAAKGPSGDETGDATTEDSELSGSSGLSGSGSGRRLGAVLYESDEGDRRVGVKVEKYVTVTTLKECLVSHCEQQVAHQCQLAPSFLTLVGQIGVMLMFFESGLFFNFSKARHVGPKACAVSLVGFVLPLVMGMLLTIIYGKPLVPDGIYVGTALVPTSISFALRLLSEAGVLQEEFSQSIVTAAFGSDILSLIWFCVMFNWRTEFNAIDVVLLPCVGIVITVIAMLSAVFFWPNVIKAILARVPESLTQRVSSKERVLFFIMMFIAVGYATVFHFLGIYLWGCFVAGMSFACVHEEHGMHSVWVRQTKRATSWMIRIFFAAAIGFSIPVSTFFTWGAFWKGTIMGIGPCILTKVFCAVFMGQDKFLIGWAMVGRAELAYFIAQMAFSANMMDSETFSITIWALLYATVFAPLIFRKVLAHYLRIHRPDEQDEADKQAE